MWIFFVIIGLAIYLMLFAPIVLTILVASIGKIWFGLEESPHILLIAIGIWIVAYLLLKKKKKRRGLGPWR